MVVGVKESATMNKLFTFLNIVVIGFIVVVGAFKADLNNWMLNPDVYLLIHFKVTGNHPK